MSLDSVAPWYHEFFPALSYMTGGKFAMVVLVFLLSFGSMLLIARRLNAAGKERATGAHEFVSDAGIVFQFAGQNCTAMTPSARAFLGENPADAPWLVILGKFKNHSLEASLIDLTRLGMTFRQTLEDSDGSFYQIEGQPVHGLCEVTFADVTQSHREKLRLEAELAQARQALARTEQVLEDVPAIAWIEDADGTMVWSNAAYTELCIGDPEADRGPVGQFRHDDLRGLQLGQQSRLAVFNENTIATWYGMTKSILEGDQFLYVGVSEGKVVDAEQTLHRFICTLTETFAHIPIGLAVFDADRSLSMFNPALSELLSIDPAWLAARPDFIGFLERLREQRKMPEARDFVSWREKINAIADSARRGDFCEDWDLPGGQTLRVTGSPHPKDAVALLFEDISIAKSLEQKFRGQIEFSQTILATLSEGVAVFDTAGALVYSNRSFETIWGFKPKALAQSPTIHDIKDAFEARSQAQSLFDKTLDFVTATGQRTSWRAQFDTHDGKTLLGQFAPLPDGSTLTAFLDVTKGGATLGEITSAYSQLMVERQDERQIIGLSLEHLRTYMSNHEGSDARDVRAIVGDKLSLLEGLINTRQAPPRTSLVAVSAEPDDLTGVFAAGRSRGLVIAADDAKTLQDAFDRSGIGQDFVRSLLALVSTLVASGGTATVRGEMEANNAQLLVDYLAQDASDLEERRFSLVISLLRELALKHDVSLTFEPGKRDGAIHAAFSFPVSEGGLHRIQSQIA